MTFTEQDPSRHSNEKPSDLSEEGFDPPIPFPTIPYDWKASQRITSQVDCIPPYALPASLHDPKRNGLIPHLFKYSPMLDQTNNPVAHFRPILLIRDLKPMSNRGSSISSEFTPGTELRARRDVRSNSAREERGNDTESVDKAPHVAIEGKPLREVAKPDCTIKQQETNEGDVFNGDFLEENPKIGERLNPPNETIQEQHYDHHHGEHRWEEIELDPNPDAAGWMKVEATDYSTSSESGLTLG